ncbi:hypothetical protein D3C78_1982960 [compost metagenome]
MVNFFFVITEVATGFTGTVGITQRLAAQQQGAVNGGTGCFVGNAGHIVVV